MEGLQKAFRSAISEDPNLSSIASSIEKAKSSFNSSLSSASSNASGSSSALSADQTQLLLTRSSGRVVSLWTCSKLCAFCFVAGIFVGYTLKRRVRRWAGRFLRRLKDD